ncbi:hypothetical protein GCM10023170_050190 [Phytohabitans houttuyneae]|uniref:Uncharacterized protein n=1 Tax=Phytohabitans houttuyneae TaxID=1076126 RepID=A0A6V8KML7_9ACTN|nr:hypothetical protein Phou_092840 [Phytohabitans houttuyneae]
MRYRETVQQNPRRLGRSEIGAFTHVQAHAGDVDASADESTGRARGSAGQAPLCRTHPGPT